MLSADLGLVAVSPPQERGRGVIKIYDDGVIFVSSPYKTRDDDVISCDDDVSTVHRFELKR